MRRSAIALIPMAALACTANVYAWQDAKAPWVFDLPNGGTNCTVLSETTDPVRYDVSFEADIRPIVATLCNTCHIAGSTAGFNINFSNARINLIGADETGAAASGSATILRVRPGVPTASAFFDKINCANPPFGGPMPPGGGATTQLQALVHDWIAAGALMPDSPGGDRTFIGNFESIVRPAPPL
jgi:hypothetical protein